MDLFWTVLFITRRFVSLLGLVGYLVGVFHAGGGSLLNKLHVLRRLANQSLVPLIQGSWMAPRGLDCSLSTLLVLAYAIFRRFSSRRQSSAHFRPILLSISPSREWRCLVQCDPWTWFWLNLLRRIFPPRGCTGKAECFMTQREVFQ